MANLDPELKAAIDESKKDITPEKKKDVDMLEEEKKEEEPESKDEKMVETEPVNHPSPPVEEQVESQIK